MTPAYRVCRDPFIACRVTKLNIIPAATTEGDPESRTPTFSSRIIETLQAIRFTIYTSIQISLNNRNIFLHTAGSPVDLAPPVVTDLMKSIFPGLTSLERLSVDFWHPPTVYDIHSVLSTAWPAIGGHMKTLFLGGNLATFRHIIATHPVLPALQELIVQLTDPFTDTRAENMDVLNNTIAPFVNSFAATLEGFTFWSWASLDISSLFTNLGFFPMMKRIQVRLSFNKALASDPAGLAQFVQRHQNTLEELQLWLNPSGAAADHSLDLPLSQWLSRTMAEVQQFPLMKELQFYPTRLEAGFDALILAITLSLETLTTLVVRDLYLSSAQVMTLLDTLGKQGPNLKLRSLRMNVFNFKADLMDALVAQLPALTSLNLYIGDSSTNQASCISFFCGCCEDDHDETDLGFDREHDGRPCIYSLGSIQPWYLAQRPRARHRLHARHGEEYTLNSKFSQQRTYSFT